jgi:hypothetical protein
VTEAKAVHHSRLGRCWPAAAALMLAALALAGAANASGHPPLHVFQIRSPTHNLYCDVGDEDQVHCLSRKKPQSAVLSYNGKVTRCSGKRCVANQRLFTAPIPVLRYGQKDVQGPYTCTSQMSGMKCVLTKGPGRGNGFQISSTAIRRIRPTG